MRPGNTVPGFSLSLNPATCCARLFGERTSFDARVSRTRGTREPGPGFHPLHHYNDEKPGPRLCAALRAAGPGNARVGRNSEAYCAAGL
jgi:hypothetical protein